MGSWGRRRRRGVLWRLGRAVPLAWRRSPVRRRPPGSALLGERLLQRPAKRRRSARDAYRERARRAELRRKVRDRRYLERAIRYLAQIMIDGRPPASRS